MEKNLSINTESDNLILELKRMSEKKGISRQEIEDKIGLKKSNISRMFNLQVTPNMRTFLKGAKAIGVSVVLKDDNT